MGGSDYKEIFQIWEESMEEVTFRKFQIWKKGTIKKIFQIWEEETKLILQLYQSRFYKYQPFCILSGCFPCGFISIPVNLRC